MSLEKIIQRVMALQVTQSLMANKKKAKHIDAEITAINEAIGKKVDGLYAILQGQDNIEAEVFKIISAMLPADYHQLQLIHHHIIQIDEQTKRIQGAGYFALLDSAIFKKIETYEKPLDHIQLENNFELPIRLSAFHDFCEANRAHLYEQIVERLKQESLFYSFEEYHKRFFDKENDNMDHIRDCYYASIETIIKRFADINLHIKSLHHQHYAFTQMQFALYDKSLSLPQRETRFFTLLKNYMMNDYPVPIDAMELSGVIVLPESETKRYLQTMQRSSEAFLQEVQEEMDRKLRQKNLYQTFEQYCDRSIATDLFPNESVQKKAERLLNQYYCDRYCKITELASVDAEFRDMVHQHQAIINLQIILNDATLSAVERCDKFHDQVRQQSAVLSRGFEPATEKWLKSVLVFMATVLTLGVASYFAYQTLFSTTGSLFVEDALAPNESLSHSNLPYAIK